jgi:hypothetical protein
MNDIDLYLLLNLNEEGISIENTPAAKNEEYVTL